MLDNLQKYDIVLASNSPRRRELLAGLGLDFRVGVLSGVDENYPSTLPVREVAEYIARAKAQAISCLSNFKQIVLANAMYGNDNNHYWVGYWETDQGNGQKSNYVLIVNEGGLDKKTYFCPSHENSNYNAGYSIGIIRADMKYELSCFALRQNEWGNFVLRDVKYDSCYYRVNACKAPSEAPFAGDSIGLTDGQGRSVWTFDTGHAEANHYCGSAHPNSPTNVGRRPPHPQGRGFRGRPGGLLRQRRARQHRLPLLLHRQRQRRHAVLI